MNLKEVIEKLKQDGVIQKGWSLELENVDIEITRSRWNVYITIRDKNGNELKLIASADAWFTEHDWIWFGTEEEYNKLLESEEKEVNG